MGLSKCAGGGDDGITNSYPGGGGRYGGGAGLLTLALTGSTIASSISLSKWYLCKSVAIRSRDGVFFQLHQHRAMLNTNTRPARPPNTIPTIPIALTCWRVCGLGVWEEDVGDAGGCVHGRRGVENGEVWMDMCDLCDPSDVLNCVVLWSVSSESMLDGNVDARVVDDAAIMARAVEGVAVIRISGDCAVV